ncbi:hypothetical protein, variant [Aphanomyces astaci]|uniref:SWIRM domain-containing protein n=1 Tax=Aphanomyces astaci TaxID=112090 RepID=W4GMD3_APHAT|nr:hypothetical protein, variant [Aphanomyces astaci]ETV80179.1 hypothetical protein, variant [Aphanomyces astaci]|eukprot:XP_009830103.1 hypothetical protein, variant [Aphanomyces astaci]
MPSTKQSTLIRPTPGQERTDAGFRACMASRFPDMTQEQLDALVAVWHAGVLPGLMFRNEALFTTYIVPLLQLATPSHSTIIEHVRTSASKSNDASVNALLDHSNLASTSPALHIDHNDGFRIVGSIGEYVAVHWRGLPDAYDTFVLRSELPSTSPSSSIDTIQALTLPSLVVSSDFHHAVATYTPLWVNPLDFAVETPSSSTTAKKIHSHDDQPQAKKPRVDPSILQRLQGDAAAAVATLLTDAAASIDESSNVLYGHLAPTAAPPLKATTVLTVDQPSVVVPSCSRWFSLHSIHPLEKRMLPEFFQDNKAKPPTVYMTYRNYMVNASRAAPHVYLTATACRRNLAGDACAILRVHEFLMHWGLINYHVPAHAAPPLQNDVPSLASFDLTHLSSSESIGYPQLKAASSVCESCAEAHPVQFELTVDAKRKERLVQHGLPHRKLDAWGARPGSGVCGACFAGRKFPSHLDPSDFTALAPVSTTTNWTAVDKRRLLDALTDVDTSQPVDWNDIAMRVGRPAKECLAQFLKTPLEQRETNPSELHDRLQTYPHVTAVPDLAGIVARADPSLAKAAAAAAIVQLEQLNKQRGGAVVAQGQPHSVAAAAQALAKTASIAGMTTVKGEATHEAAAEAHTTAATAVAVLAAKAQVCQSTNLTYFSEHVVDSSYDQGYCQARRRYSQKPCGHVATMPNAAHSIETPSIGPAGIRLAS